MVSTQQFERLLFSVSRMLSREQVDDTNTVVELIRLFDLDALRIKLRRTVWARPLATHTFAFPVDWKQAVKQRFAPRWVLRRWPVRLAEFDLTIYHKYPVLMVGDSQPAVLHAEVRELTHG